MNADKHILLIDDDRLDAIMLRRAFRDAEIHNPLHIVSTGEEALAFLQDAPQTRPSLILLDLNMPRMSGIEFLRAIKQDDRWRSIPIIILTTSTHEQDRQQCYDLSAAGYIVKPMDYQQFVMMMRIVRDYWSINQL